jgi:hypothetical protein
MKFKMKNKRFTFFVMCFLLLLSFVFLLRNFEPFNTIDATELQKQIDDSIEDIYGNLVSIKDVHLSEIQNILV